MLIVCCIRWLEGIRSQIPHLVNYMAFSVLCAQACVQPVSVVSWSHWSIPCSLGQGGIKNWRSGMCCLLRPAVSHIVWRLVEICI